ncbi:ABC transporter substrate-binding protein [Dactylosporangium sp. CA-092794]|uniref:ABC transporter substrate-binding protein n=1 Tax=Dactylosporangium sp. CA-092794 TaxID=3239929 RepID=UPI003D9378B3
MTNGTPNRPVISRRIMLRAGLGVGLGALAGPALAACGGVSTSGASGESGTVNFLCTQFTPVEERQRFEKILGKRVTAAKVAYNPVDAGVFASTLQSQVDAGKVQISLVGGVHGDLAPHAGRLLDLDDIASALTDRGIDPELMALGKLGGGTTKYIPWMQASYVLAVHKKATQWLPSGVDPQRLTYDQLLSWATAARQGNGGKPVFGLPAGPKGLYHRFFQGFLLPSFTGGQITTFRSPEAAQAWTYMKDLWAVTAPASTNYDSMQEPLQRGEVLMAWDHVARLADAPKDKPDDWLMLPAPSGPKGLGYLLVVAGLAIPRGAPDVDKAKEVIKALSVADTQLDVLRDNAFFPVVKATLPGDLPPAIALEAAAVQKQQNDTAAIVSLPPVGLGSKDGEVSQIFKDTFKQVCIDGKPVQPVLDNQAKQLNAILDEVKVPCWKPDPAAAACRAA